MYHKRRVSNIGIVNQGVQVGQVLLVLKPLKDLSIVWTKAQLAPLHVPARATSHRPAASSDQLPFA